MAAAQTGDVARARLPGAVLALGLASLLTDMASEMIYPLLPVFLVASLSAGPFSLGLIEGVAESTAGLLKLVSGVWSDRRSRRKPLVMAGYGLAGLVRPLIGFATSWWNVLAIRFADRIGKGLRASPRDALIADVTPVHMRGRAFGVHRAMDHAGAVAGPLVASALMLGAGWSVRHVFLAAAIPGAVVLIALALLVREPPRVVPPATVALPLRVAIRRLGPEYRRALLAMFVFTLGNSTDAFLLLRLSDSGVEPSWIALLWSAHHVVKMVSAYAGGRLADRVGRRAMLAAGWLIYAAIYGAFAILTSTSGLIAAFLTYGLYFGLTEPAARAWMADLAPPDQRGAAFGGFHLVVGVAALPASALFGAVWYAAGPSAAFGAGAALAAVAAGLLVRARPASE